MKYKLLFKLFLAALFLQGVFISTTNAQESKIGENQPEVVFETNKGSFTLKLNPLKAPKTVANFLKYVDEGFYDKTLFHRSIPGFVVQGGGFEQGMKQKETRKPVKNESSNLLKNSRGTISMARKSHPDTATSQFYINLGENKNLDYKSQVQPGYTVFGEISEGMDIIDKIVSLPTKTVEKFRDVPKEDVIVISAKRKNIRKTVANKEINTKAEDKRNKGLERFVEGEHYTVLDTPVATRDSNKIEVVEMFSYGCPHCYEFEADVKSWGKKQVGDVDFWFFPAVWNKSMNLYAKAFYTAHELKVEDKIHMPLFHSIVVKQKNITNENDLAEFFSNYGVDKKKFKEVFNSKSVEEQTASAEQRVRSYKPAGVPEIVVNGKYRIGRMRAGGMKEMLAVADYLVNKERQEINSKN